MAITSANNTYDAVLSDDGNLKSFFENAINVVNSSSTWNQGDNLCLDSSSGCLRAVTADTDQVSYMGVAANSVVAGILQGPYPSTMATIAAEQPMALQGPLYGCVVSRTIHTGDDLTLSCKLYLPSTGTTQMFTVTDTVTNGDFSAIYMGPAVASAVAGAYYPCKVGIKFATATTLQY